MPLREYVCHACGHSWDELVRKPEEEPTACPVCTEDAFEPVISAHGGYDFNSGPASVRPKGAGSFRGKK